MYIYFSKSFYRISHFSHKALLLFPFIVKKNFSWSICSKRVFQTKRLHAWDSLQICMNRLCKLTFSCICNTGIFKVISLFRHVQKAGGFQQNIQKEPNITYISLSSSICLSSDGIWRSEDVGVVVVLCMFDNGATVLCVHNNLRGSLQKPTSLKGQGHEIFDFNFPQAPEYRSRALSNIFSICGEIRSSRRTTSVNDTCGKCKKSSIGKVSIILFGHLCVEELTYNI